ncbi:MAG: isoprenoid biosynthesis protein ElbB [Deltaproteobacteria bacterium CG11_big_fil_rev_8_21_14_0_20_47_16]|nr:MAG: isoprenoid biosynthesis protein ElbB [Deltaproteobacteria bacterium CG11_big_fil_rev_8_21_14_0_20_47_16]
MSKKVAVLLGGCGHLDGSEIRESILSLLALDRANAEVMCMAPNDAQKRVVHHGKGEVVPGARNMIEEASRIARGKIVPLDPKTIAEYDALVIPGGTGLAFSFFDYATSGRDCSIRSDVQEAILNMVKAKKPIAAICISPMIVARALKDSGISVTLGSTPNVKEDMMAWGSKFQECQVDDCVVDVAHKIVTTPAYMYGDAHIRDAATGIEKCINSLMKLTL